MKIKNILFIAFAVSLIGCSDNNIKQDRLILNTILAEEDSDLQISEESMNTIIESIPSPLEISFAIKLSGAEFNEDFLNTTDNASKLTTDMSKAMGIGILSGDLGYINMYEKSYMAMNYLNSIKRLADDIKVGQFFDFATIKRLAANSSKIDSLIHFSTTNFNNMDTYLRSKKRSNMSILMVTGTWIEGLYIATQNFKATNNQETMQWIGSQKVIVDQLVLGLSAFADESYFELLIADMNSLKSQYDDITINYEYHEPEAIEIDGRLEIVDNSKSTVEVYHDQIFKISDIIEQMRNRLYSGL